MAQIHGSVYTLSQNNVYQRVQTVLQREDDPVLWLANSELRAEMQYAQELPESAPQYNNICRCLGITVTTASAPTSTAAKTASYHADIMDTRDPAACAPYPMKPLARRNSTTRGDAESESNAALNAVLDAKEGPALPGVSGYARFPYWTTRPLVRPHILGGLLKVVTGNKRTYALKAKVMQQQSAWFQTMSCLKYLTSIERPTIPFALCGNGTYWCMYAKNGDKSKNLAVWPAFPIVIDYRHSGSGITPNDEDDVIAALEQPNRVCDLRLAVTGSQLGKMATAMQEPLLVLAHLEVFLTGGDVPVLPAKFSGGSAPCLQVNLLTHIVSMLVSAFLGTASSQHRYWSLHWPPNRSSDHSLSSPLSTIFDNTLKTRVIHVVAPHLVEEPVQSSPVEEPVPIAPHLLIEEAVQVTPPQPAKGVIEVVPQPTAEETQFSIDPGFSLYSPDDVSTVSSPFDLGAIPTVSSSVALTRTPSSVSMVSSISLGSDILDNRTLFEEPILEDVSTEPSFLSTHMRPISSANIPLPRTPSLLSTPTASASWHPLSKLHPNGHDQKGHHQGPSVIITDDINWLLQYLHGVENNRQRDN
ncbi:hypothetical protein EDB89DRAFT_2070470 [Lactarius sanguifluus]|nr:hypothetical protein EDB89DRAFT_2070470 [Lactarius sanguifluus]